MPKVEDGILLDIVKRHQGLTTNEVIDRTSLSRGSFGLVSLRLRFLEEQGKVRSEVRKHQNTKPVRYWWPV